MSETSLTERARKMLGVLCEQRIHLHGVMVTQNGDTVLEAYFSPGSPAAPHRLYSASKSITALAVGILVGRGLIDLDRRGAEYCPELITPDTPPEAAATTLRDMLRMATCHTHRAHNVDTDFSWARAYYNTPAAHAPGMAFGYDSTGTQILTLICRKLTGQTMLDFLQGALFDPIGATDEKSWLTDPSGIEQGGSGLHMTLRDFSKVANFCMTDGLGILPTDYLRAATSHQINTSLREGEERFGYGYQFWMTRNGYAMRGMDGQTAIIVPERGLVLTTTGDTHGQPQAAQQVTDAFYDCVVNG